MSKIKLTGSNSGYVEISSAADAGNLTLQLPTAGSALLSNAGNVFTGITTFTGVNITDDITFNGASYNVLWDKSDNQLEFGDNAKLSFGSASPWLQLYHSGSHAFIANTGGQLAIRCNTTLHLSTDQGVDHLLATKNADVKLYFNGGQKFQTTNTGAVVTGICTATSFSGSGENLTRTTQSSHRNIIINGAMMVAQRGTSSTSSGYHTLDRFNVQFGGTDEPMTVEQANVASGTTPYTLGFLKCLKVTNGNQTSGAGGGDWLEIYQYLEDQDICNSGWNFKSATSYLTISFWVKSSVSQKFTGFFYTNNAGQGDSYTYSYQIDNGSGGNLSANTWTKITHSIPGASNLTFNNDNTRGLAVGIFPYDGTDYTTSGHTEETWQQWSSGNKLKDMDSTWWTTNDATFEITGLQLEVGQQATPFEHRSFTDELSRCQRYFVKTNFTSHCTAYFGGTHLFRQIQFVCPTPMRAQPSFSVTGNEGSTTKFTLKTWSSDQNMTATPNSVHRHHTDYVHGTNNGAVHSVALGIDFSSGNSGIPPNGPGNHNVYACRMYGANLDAEL